MTNGNIVPLPRQGVPTPKVYSLDQYLDLDFGSSKEREIIAHGVLREQGRLVIGAFKGVGKTLIGSQIMLCLSSANSLFGIFDIPGRKRVLMLQKEVLDGDFQERLESAVRRFPGIQPQLWYIPERRTILDLYLDHPQGLATIEELIRLYQPDVVIIDPLTAFYTFDDMRGDNIKKLLYALDRLSATYGVAWIITQHTRKIGNDYRGRKIPQTMNDIIGSSAFIFWADTIFTMNQQDKDKVLVDTFIRSSSDAHPSLVLTLDRTSACFDGVIQDYATSGDEFTAAGILAKNSGVMKYSDLIYDIIKKANVPERKAQIVVSALQSKSLIYITGIGKDRIVRSLSPAARAWIR